MQCREEGGASGIDERQHMRSLSKRPHRVEASRLGLLLLLRARLSRQSFLPGGDDTCRQARDLLVTMLAQAADHDTNPSGLEVLAAARNRHQLLQSVDEVPGMIRRRLEGCLVLQ